MSQGWDEDKEEGFLAPGGLPGGRIHGEEEEVGRWTGSEWTRVQFLRTGRVEKGLTQLFGDFAYP
jgi:hypothetical protein